MPSSLIIKLNNFILYASLSCLLPYLGVYFFHYTHASPWELGKVKLISSWVGIAFKFTLCSLADRYRAYRSIYLVTLFAAFVGLTGLYVPLFFGSNPRQQQHQQQPTLVTDLPCEETTTATSFPITTESRDSETVQIDQQEWLYYVATCMIISSMSVSVCKSLNESFTANIAHLNNIPFGSVRIYGSLGWILASLLQVFVNKFKSDYFLLQSLVLYSAFASLNLLLVTLWPDKKPFKLDLEPTTNDWSKDCSQCERVGCEFKFISSYLWPKSLHTVANYETNMHLGIGSMSDVIITKAEVNFQFDTRAEDAFRNIRRCSLAPLGDSFVIKQFELDNQSKKHFNHVTKIHPVGQDSSSDMPTTMELIVDSGGNSISRHDSILSTQVAINPSYLPTDYNDDKSKELGFMLHCRIIHMIASRNKSVYRFWILSAINGFIISMSWTYLIPYLKSLDCEKFSSLAAYILLINQLCQAIFYRFLSSYMSKTVDHFTSISLVQLNYGLRYALYLIFISFNETIPLELILLIETTHLFGVGWLNCVTNELALKFAHEARDCIPELIRLRLIEDNEQDRQKVSNAVKVTMLGISSCCFEGLGVAFGALTSGWLVGTYGYATFWTIGSFLAFLSGLINGSINFKDYYIGKGYNKT